MGQKDSSGRNKDSPKIAAGATKALAPTVPGYRARSAIASAFGLGRASLPSVIESEETSSNVD